MVKMLNLDKKIIEPKEAASKSILAHLGGDIITCLKKKVGA